MRFQGPEQLMHLNVSNGERLQCFSASWQKHLQELSEKSGTEVNEKLEDEECEQK